MLKAGFINVLKPTGMTSNDLVAKLRGMIRRGYGEKIKVGHTGTLDPNAAGVMLVALGSATKFCKYVIEKDKSYRADLLFGPMTDTLDTYGTITENQASRPHDSAELVQILRQFQGTSLQVPPKYSALKIDGERLYKLARADKEIPEIQAREIHIPAIELLETRADGITIDVACSSGTYIRSLARDIGQALGEKAILSLLIRTDLDGHRLADSFILEELETLIQEQKLDQAIMDTDKLLDKFEELHLQAGEKLYTNGAAIQTKRYIGAQPQAGQYRLYSQGKFLGIGKVTTNEKGTTVKSETLVV